MTHQLRILHISDLRQRGSRDADAWRRRPVVGKAWARNLDALLEEGPFDLVALTGDVADSGAPDEYLGAATFVSELLERLRLDASRLFIVPGDHDVVRAPAPADAARPEALRGDASAFRHWVGVGLGRPELAGDGPGYRVTLPAGARPFPVHVIGLDSSWLSAADDGHTMLGEAQLAHLEGLGGFRVGLCHHPPTAFLDAASIVPRLADGLDVLLCGPSRHAASTHIAPDRAARLFMGGRLFDEGPRAHAASVIGAGQDVAAVACHAITITLDAAGHARRHDVRTRRWSPTRLAWLDEEHPQRRGRAGARTTAPTSDHGATTAGIPLALRALELEGMATALLGMQGAPTVCTLWGMPGVGKAHLVDRFVTTYGDAFPGGYRHLVLVPDDRRSSATLLGQLAEASGVPLGRDLGARLAAELAAQRVLVHVEGVDRPPVGRVVAELAAALPGCAVLVSGRLRGAAKRDGWAQIELEPPDARGGLELLTTLHRPAKSEAEKKELGRLCHALGQLPLSLVLAAGVLREGRQPSEIIDRLRKRGLSLDPVGPNGRIANARELVDIAAEVLGHKIGERATLALSALSALALAPACGFGTSLGASVAGLSRAHFADLVAAACDVGLLSPVPAYERPEAAWRMHPLVAERLAERGGSAVGRVRAQTWFFDRMARRAGDVGWQELRPELAGLAEWLATLLDGDVEAVRTEGAELALAHGPTFGWLDVFERALAATSDPAERVTLLSTLGELAARAGVRERALSAARERLSIEKGRGAHREAAGAAGELADLLEAAGELDEALRVRRDEELPIYTRLGAVHDRAVTLGQIADILERQGALDEALRIRRDEELPVYARLGHEHDRAITLGQIATILERKGERDHALEVLETEVLPLTEDASELRLRGVTLGRIADIRQARGELETALTIRREHELPIFTRLADARERAITMGRIAGLLEALGHLDDALAIRLEDELEVYRRLGDTRAEARARVHVERLRRALSPDPEPSAPEPAAMAPAPEPITPEPGLAPEPEALPVPEPVVDAAAEPVADAAPEPAADAAPEPVVDMAPEPVVDMAPEPVVDPAPEPVVDPAPEPVADPAPEAGVPAAEPPPPEPEPATPAPVMPEPEPEPVMPAPEPEPVVPAPEPEPATPEPEPIAPEPEPAPVVPEPSPTPAEPAPARPEPTPAPAEPEPTPAPAEPEPTPAPAEPEPEPTPAPAEPEPTPAPAEPEPEPAPILAGVDAIAPPSAPLAEPEPAALPAASAQAPLPPEPPAPSSKPSPRPPPLPPRRLEPHQRIVLTRFLEQALYSPKRQSDSGEHEHDDLILKAIDAVADGSLELRAMLVELCLTPMLENLCEMTWIVCTSTRLLEPDPVIRAVNDECRWLEARRRAPIMPPGSAARESREIFEAAMRLERLEIAASRARLTQVRALGDARGVVPVLFDGWDAELVATLHPAPDEPVHPTHERPNRTRARRAGTPTGDVAASAAQAPPSPWYTRNESPTVVVFVSGVPIEGAPAWRSEEGAYWPELVRTDPAFGSPSIFLTGVEPQATPSPERLANDLMSATLDSGVLHRRRIFFVAHTMGAIALLEMLVRYHEAFVDRRVGVVLLAAPLPPQIPVPPSATAPAAPPTTASPAEDEARAGDRSVDLDRRFREVLTALPSLSGVELITPMPRRASRWRLPWRTVGSIAVHSYFRERVVIPGTDDQTIAAPASAAHPAHAAVRRFFVDVFAHG